MKFDSLRKGTIFITTYSRPVIKTGTSSVYNSIYLDTGEPLSMALDAEIDPNDIVLSITLETPNQPYTKYDCNKEN